MRAERLALMAHNAVGFDLETHRIQPGLVAPPIVVGSLAVPAGNGRVVGELLDLAGARAAFAGLLADPRYTLVMANGSFDLICLINDAARLGVDLAPQVFDLFDPTHEVLTGTPDGRVFDVLIAEALHAIGAGHLLRDPGTGQKIRDSKGRDTNRYSLDVVTWLVRGVKSAKTNDRYREAYAEFDGWSIARLLAEAPYEARTYPVDDAVNQVTDGLAQAGHLPALHEHTWAGDQCTSCGQTGQTAGRLCWTQRPRWNLHDLSRQTYAAFALALGAAWGFVVDQDAVDAVERKYEAEHQQDLSPFIEAGILRGPDDKKPLTENQSVLKRRVAWAYGARESCPTCQGTSKVPSPATNGKTRINCSACGATGLVLTEMVPRTPTEGVKTDKDSLEGSGDDLLVNYEAHCDGAKIPTTYLPYLRHQYKEHDLRSDGSCARCGAPTEKRCQPPNWRSLPLNLRPNVLVETGRTSYSDPAQTFPRSWGLRECIRAREGRLFGSIDYKAGELVTHAQNCLDIVGFSELARALNKGLDPHLALACTTAGVTYEFGLANKKTKRIADLRQASKPANFGFPGGMGAHKLVLTQRRQGPDTPWPDGPSWIPDGKGKGGRVRGYRGLRFCLLMGRADACGTIMLTTYRDRPIAPACKHCLECAEEIKATWLRQWPENNPRDGYFKFVNRWADDGVIEQMVSRRRRAGIDYCSAANGMFQARLAEAAKNALCALQRECYDRTIRIRSDAPGAKLGTRSLFAGGPSPLFGSRVIVFQHDEVLPEFPAAVAHEGALRTSEVMVEALRIVCPDLAPAVEAEPCLMSRWYKGAEAVWHGGRLVPWTPQHDPKTCTECDRKAA